MKKIISLLSAILLSFQVFGAETDDAVAKLQNQVVLLIKIKRFVDVQDQGRLIVLKNSTEQTINRIKTDGLIHTRTLNEYLKQYITYKSSTAYFSYINSSAIAMDVKSLYDIMDAISKERGLDDFAFNKMTYNTFSQMHALIQEVMKGNIDASFKEELNAINVDFGHLLATANGGDNIPTFKAGEEMYRKIEALYPKFFKVSNSGPLYDIILNIQGLNELYSEYAGI
jgi:hypothetical protein